MVNWRPDNWGSTVSVKELREVEMMICLFFLEHTAFANPHAECARGKKIFLPNMETE